MDTYRDRTKVPKYFQMCWISVPYFDVKEENEYQNLYEVVRLVEIICKEKIKLN